jgi:hypothetical protein
MAGSGCHLRGGQLGVELLPQPPRGVLCVVLLPTQSHRRQLLGGEVEERLRSGEAARGGRTAGAMGCGRREGTAGAMGGCSQRRGLRGGAGTLGARRGMRARWHDE